MKITRREFLKLSGGATGFLLTSSVFDLVKIPKALANMGAKTGTETTSICCFCACGCGVIATASGGAVVNLEGDPTHPVNEGALCSKGLSNRQTATQLTSVPPVGMRMSTWPAGTRLNRCLYRAPNATQWLVIDWNTALNGGNVSGTAVPGIGPTVFASRGDYEAFGDGMTVNRWKSVACLGGAAHDNQECYLLRKLMTGLGLVYIEHQARI